MEIEHIYSFCGIYSGMRISHCMTLIGFLKRNYSLAVFLCNFFFRILVNCPLGFYFTENDCRACPEDQYQNQEAQSSCILCPSGTVTFGKTGSKWRKSCQGNSCFLKDVQTILLPFSSCACFCISVRFFWFFLFLFLLALSFHQKLRSLILCDLHFFPLEIPSMSSDEEQSGLKPVTLYSSIAAGSVLFIISLIIIAIFYGKKHRR